MNTSGFMILAAPVALLTSITLADDAMHVSAAAQAAVAEAVRPGLVQVEYTLRYDQGEAPQSTGWTYTCPSCGGQHAVDLQEFITEERTADRAGYLLTEDTVLTDDLLLHPRFIETVAVRFGEHTVSATPMAYGEFEPAVFLRLEEPLPDAQPIPQAPDAEPEPIDDGDEIDSPAASRVRHQVSYAEVGGDWHIGVSPFGGTITIPEHGRPRQNISGPCIIVDDDGRLLGASMDREIEPGEAGLGSPLDWQTISAESLEAQLDEAAALADASLLRVALSFRSPRSDSSSGGMWGGYHGDGGSSTERNVPGVMLDESHVLVLQHMDPTTTARLERIRVFDAEGERTPATFLGTLENYGGFIATLDAPRENVPPLSRDDIRDHRRRLISEAEIRIQGEHRQVFYNRCRLTGFEMGWREQVYPALQGVSDREGTNARILFSPEGELLAFPIPQRQKVAVEERWSGDYPKLTAACYFADLLDDPELHFDPNNVPLTEDEENRVAWLGVEFQAIDREIARASGISDQTRDGSIGVIVNHIYEGSPAEKIGLQVGDVVVRLHAPDQPRPIELEQEYGYNDFMGGGFPWDEYDSIPEDYFEYIPQPWPSASDNVINSKLTAIGFGQEVEVEYLRDGETQGASFTVEQSPPHYAAAPRFKSEALGATVRDLTYEARRYFQRSDDEPGVVLSKIEPGSKASIAGLRPFEVITHVNDVAVKAVDEFEEAIQGRRELRLTVRRMLRGRVVNIALDTGAEEESPPAVEVAEDGADTPEGVGDDVGAAGAALGEEVESQDTP